MRDDTKSERVALRAAMRFYLKSTQLIARSLGDGDVLRGLIVLAINYANVAHIGPEDDRYADAENPVPDAERRPISVHALALELGIPYETVRRHVNALIKAGLCRREGRGVIMPANALANASFRFRKNLENVRDFVGDLRRADLLLPTEGQPAP